MTKTNLPLKLEELSAYKPQILEEGQTLCPERRCGIIYCRKGGLEVTAEGKMYRVGTGDLFIYVNSTIISLGERSENLEGVAEVLNISATERKRYERRRCSHLVAAGRKQSEWRSHSTGG